VCRSSLLSLPIIVGRRRPRFPVVCPHCSPFPPREQSLTVVVGGCPRHLGLPGRRRVRICRPCSCPCSCPVPVPAPPNPPCKQLLTVEVGVLGCVCGSGRGLRASRPHCRPRLLSFPIVVIPVCCHSCLLSSPPVVVAICCRPRLCLIPIPVLVLAPPPIHPASSCLQWRWGCWVMTVVPAVVFVPVVPVAVPLAPSFHLPLTVFSSSHPVLSASVSLGCVELEHGRHSGYRGCQR